MAAQPAAEAEPPQEDATALVLRPGQGAPAPNELTSSADEAEDDEYGMVTVMDGDIEEGCWAVLFGLSKKPELNGRLVRVCSHYTPCWWLVHNEDDYDEARWYVEVVEGPARRLHARRANLHAVHVEEAIGRLLNRWIDTGPATSTFSVAAWQALGHSETMRKRERALVHGFALDLCQQRGVRVEKVAPNDRATPSGHPDRQVHLRLVDPPITTAAVTLGTNGAAGAAIDDAERLLLIGRAETLLLARDAIGPAADSVMASSGETHAAGSSALVNAASDMRQLPFLRLCQLLEALEQVSSAWGPKPHSLILILTLTFTLTLTLTLTLILGPTLTFSPSLASPSPSSR